MTRAVRVVFCGRTGRDGREAARPVIIDVYSRSMPGGCSPRPRAPSWPRWLATERNGASTGPAGRQMANGTRSVCAGSDMIGSRDVRGSGRTNAWAPNANAVSVAGSRSSSHGIPAAPSSEVVTSIRVSASRSLTAPPQLEGVAVGLEHLAEQVPAEFGRGG